MNVPELWYQMPCPSGKNCPAGNQDPPATTGIGYWTDQGALDGTTNKCNDGYQCTNTDGSIGPWEEGCVLGEWTAADTSTGCGTANCLSGKYCGQGRSYDCPAGFFCESGTAASQACPVGTYRNSVGATATGDCALCDAGYACTVRGSDRYAAQCGAGYFCLTTATTTTPKDICKNYNPTAKTCTIASPDINAINPCPNGGTLNGNDCENVPTTQSVCPQGFFCPKGTTEP